MKSEPAATIWSSSARADAVSCARCCSGASVSASFTQVPCRCSSCTTTRPNARRCSPEPMVRASPRAHDGDMPMTPTERWLVAGVDDSAHGITVAHVAQVLGRRLDLKVMLVHAIGGPAARTTLVGERRLDCLDGGREVLDAITDRL